MQEPTESIFLLTKIQRNLFIYCLLLSLFGHTYLKIKTDSKKQAMDSKIDKKKNAKKMLSADEAEPKRKIKLISLCRVYSHG
jgi:hypothetical protein